MMLPMSAGLAPLTQVAVDAGGAGFLAQIHAASRGVFVPAFQDWVDRAMRPEASSMDLVTSAIKIQKMGLERYDPDRYWSSEEGWELQTRLRDLSRDLKELPLAKISILVRGLLEDLRDDPAIHNILVERPQVLVPLRPAIPEVSWTEYADVTPSERPSWTNRLAAWWNSLRRPEVHIAGLETLREEAAGILQGGGTVFDDPETHALEEAAVLSLFRSTLNMMSSGEDAAFFTENPVSLASALELLANNHRVGLVRFSPTPMNEWGLRTLGIEPYGDPPFTWSYPLVFRMK